MKLHEIIAYTLDDGRKVKIIFVGEEKKTEITVVFEVESTNFIEMQQGG